MSATDLCSAELKVFKLQPGTSEHAAPSKMLGLDTPVALEHKVGVEPNVKLVIFLRAEPLRICRAAAASAKWESFKEGAAGITQSANKLADLVGLGPGTLKSALSARSPPDGKARRRPAYRTCIHHGWLEDGARMHHACTRVDHACTTRAIRVGHACTTRGPWLHHVRAPPHAVTPRPPGAAGAAAQGAARRAARERQPGLGALGRRPLELSGLPPAGRHRCAGQGRGQPWSGPGSALVRAGTSHG